VLVRVSFQEEKNLLVFEVEVTTHVLVSVSCSRIVWVDFTVEVLMCNTRLVEVTEHVPLVGDRVWMLIEQEDNVDLELDDGVDKVLLCDDDEEGLLIELEEDDLELDDNVEDVDNVDDVLE
jgi:hypothetical protein